MTVGQKARGCDENKTSMRIDIVAIDRVLTYHFTTPLLFFFTTAHMCRKNILYIDAFGLKQPKKKYIERESCRVVVEGGSRQDCEDKGYSKKMGG